MLGSINKDIEMYNVTILIKCSEYFSIVFCSQNHEEAL